MNWQLMNLQGGAVRPETAETIDYSMISHPGEYADRKTAHDEAANSDVPISMTASNLMADLDSSGSKRGNAAQATEFRSTSANA
jgi:hypothetical protein